MFKVRTVPNHIQQVCKWLPNLDNFLIGTLEDEMLKCITRNYKPRVFNVDRINCEIFRDVNVASVEIVTVGLVERRIGKKVALSLAIAELMLRKYKSH